MIEYTVQIHERRTEWYLNGKLHREDGPAVEYTSGTKEWYLNGKLHRVEGPAIEWSDGDKSWYLNGKRHREDGPAVEYTDGDKSWWLNGLLHREDGAAIEWASGHKEWFLNGVRVTEAEVMSPVKQPQKTWVGLTDEEVEQVFPAIAAYHAANKTLYHSIARAIETKLKELNYERRSQHESIQT